MEPVQRELEQLRERLASYDEEFEELVYAVSHDLRQPIVGILGFATILKEDLEASLEPDHEHFLQRIIDNAGKMDRILTALLSLSRAARQVDRETWNDTEPVLDEVLTSNAEAIQTAGVQVVCLPDLPRQLRGDRKDLTQLFGQLVSNGVAFRGEIATPRVEVGSVPSDDASQVHLFVRDNGIGIEPRYHEEVFKVCKKLSAGDHGRIGVGLTIAKKIVERYGGRIWVESTLGQGATFHFTWPA
jgi:signal transduction histidine kinase